MLVPSLEAHTTIMFIRSSWLAARLFVDLKAFLLTHVAVTRQDNTKSESYAPAYAFFSLIHAASAGCGVRASLRDECAY